VFGQLVRETRLRLGLSQAPVVERAGLGERGLRNIEAGRIAKPRPVTVRLLADALDPDQGLVPAGDALGGFLTVLGPPDQAVPTDLAERAAAFRSLIAGRRLLIVLDNARDADHVRPLLPGAGGCLVVVTSRNQLTSLVATEGAHPVPLTVLAHDEARSLIAARIGETRVAREPDAVSAILARCARLPLAPSVVAARARSGRTCR
jgi:transcriptional regulator with XRE-family HTH domain